MIICVVAMLRAYKSKFVHTIGNGNACGKAKFRLVILMGSVLIANCIEHSSGYLRIYTSDNTFLYFSATNVNISSVIADGLPSFEEKTTNTLQLKVSSYTPEEVDHY